MTISTAAFSMLIVIALVFTIAAPIILLALLFSDWKKRQLW